METTQTQQRIVIIGGGYAGALAANRLAGRVGRRARITVIEERDDLVHRVRLHEVVANGPSRTYPLARVLHRSVRQLRARAARVDPAQRTVTLSNGATEPFDLLLLAVGSGLVEAIPGALSHGGALRSPEAAATAHTRLLAMADGERVVVVGGGLTGVEVASEIAERHPRLHVILLARELLPSMSDAARAYVTTVLADLGVERRLESAGAIEADGVELASGERIDAGLVVWAGGFEPRGAGLSQALLHDERGRVRVDASLRALGTDGIWVAGDAVAPPPGMSFARMSCAIAMPMGAHVADEMTRALRAEPARPFRFGYAGQCVSLGRRRGVVQLVTPEDRPRPRFISGKMGAVIKELICSFVTGALRVERLFAGTYTWPRGVEAHGALAAANDAAPSLPAAGG